jgi:hypothetical protein
MIHRHKWGLWGKVAVDFYNSFGSYVYTEHQQQRRCETCGKYKRKRIR